MDQAARRAKLAARLPALGVDGLLITRLPNVRYLTGFTGSNGQLLLTASEVIFFTDGRYEEQARRQLPDVPARRYARELVTIFPQACREARVARLGFEPAGLTYGSYEKLRAAGGAELVPVGDEVEALRQAKDPEEIRAIERAQELTDEAFDRALAKLVEGITEREVALDLEDALRHGGADRVGFDTIVAFDLLEHVEDPVFVVREVGRVLRPGGRVFASSPDAQRWVWDDYTHRRPFTRKAFRLLFADQGWTVEQVGYESVAPGTSIVAARTPGNRRPFPLTTLARLPFWRRNVWLVARR